MPVNFLKIKEGRKRNESICSYKGQVLYYMRFTGYPSCPPKLRLDMPRDCPVEQELTDTLYQQGII